MTDLLLTNANLATMAADSAVAYGLLPNGSIALEQGRIVWIGLAAAMPEKYHSFPQRDLHGKLVTPALIDCHTHIVHGGERAREFEQRLTGVSYAEVAASGVALYPP